MKVNVVSLVAEFPNDNPALHGGAIWVCLDVTGAPVALPAPACPPGDADVPSMSVADLASLPLDVPVPVPVPAPDLLPELRSDGADDSAPEDVPRDRISGIFGLGETPREDSARDMLAAPSSDDEEPILVEDLPPLDEPATLEGFEPPAALATAATFEGFEPPAALVAATTIAPPRSDDAWMQLVSTLADVAIGAGSAHVASVLPALLLDGTLEPMPADAAQSLAEADVVRSNIVTAGFVAKTRAWRGILLGTDADFAACGDAMLDDWAADLLARLLGAPSRATALKRELRSRGVAAFGLVEAA